MPDISKQQVMHELAALLPPDQAVTAWQTALKGARLIDKARYRPEEVSALGRALLDHAAALHAAKR